MRRDILSRLSVVALLVAPAALSGAPQAASTPAPPADATNPAAEPPPAAEDTPRFPSGVELVTVDVVVTDKKGNPIPDLPKGAFTVEEDGTPQTIVSFEPVKVPPTASVVTPEKPRVSTNVSPAARTGRSFVIVFDDIHLAPFQAHRAKTAVAEFLRTGVREGDLVSLIATGGGVWWSTRMEAGRDELIALLKRLDGRLLPETGPDRMSDYEAMRIHVYHDVQVEQRVSRRFETYGVSNRMGQDTSNPMYADGDPMVRGRASEVYFQSVSRNRITLDVLERSLNALNTARGRKALILVSEGFIYDPNLDEFKRVTQASRRSNVAMYFLDTRGLGGLPTYASAEFGPAIDPQDIGAAFMENLEASEGSESLAADTGGFTVKNTNDLSTGIKRIADESQSYYLVGYNSTNTARDGRFRKISVKVEGKNLRVRARKGYYAPLEGGKPEKTRPGVDPQVQAALDSPYEQDDVPLRMTSYVMGETLLGKASVVVAADVDITKFAFDEKEGRLHDTLEYLLVVAHRESGEFFRYDQKVEMKLRPETRDRLNKSWYGIVKDFELAPGGYQAKIVVRDKNKGQLGTLVHEFEVPELTQFRVSTPILSDVVQPTDDPQAPPRPLLLARRTFAAGGTLFASFEVHGAEKDKKTGMPAVSAGYIIRRREGGVITQSPPTLINPTSLGKLSRMIGAPLQGGPGDYELVMTFKDTIAGKTLEVREPFTVAATPQPAG
jgi:VWFA-related protein